MRRRAHVVAQLHQVVADAPYAGFEEIAFVLVVVDAEDVEIAAGEIDDFLAPRHVVRTLLAAGDDHGVRRDLPQPASVEIDDGRVALGRKAVVHRLVVDLEVADVVRTGMSVARAHLSPRGRRRIVDVMHPVHRVLDRCRGLVRCRQHDQRVGSELTRQFEVLVCAEAVVVRVAAPYFVRVVDARGERTDAVLPLVGRGK